MIKDHDVKIVDLRFIDFPGMWQHTSYPASMLKADVFEDGMGFDGSSIRGWQGIHESDMLIVPDPNTAILDPFTQETTLVLTCNIKDPVTGGDYTRDPRNVARKAISYLQSTGIADTAYFGPEAEFFVFDDIRYDTGVNEGYYTSTPSRVSGTPVSPSSQTSVTNSATKVVISPFHRTTLSRTCVQRWSWSCKSAVSTSNVTTTRSEPPVKLKSTCASSHLSLWRTI